MLQVPFGSGHSDPTRKRLSMPDSLSSPSSPNSLALHRHSHIRIVSAPSPSSHPPPEAPSIVLLGPTFNSDLRRSGLDLIQKASLRRRHPSSAKPYQLGQLERIARTPVAKVHLVVFGGEGDRDEGERERENRTVMLHKFREAGADVVVHQTPFASKRLSRISMGPLSARGMLLRSLRGTVEEVLREGFEAAALVVSDEMDKEEVVRGFMEEMAGYCRMRKEQPPTITIYLPQHAHLGEFDLDLPSEQVYAVHIAHLAASSFEGTSRRSPSPLPLDSPHSSGAKPLLLKPAPGPGAQSITMRLRLDMHLDKDLVLKVVEAQTPIEKVVAPLKTNRTPPSSPPSSSRSPPPPPLKLAIPTQTPIRPPLQSRFSDYSPTTASSTHHSPLIKCVPRKKDSEGECVESASDTENPVWGHVGGMLRERFGNSALSRSRTMMGRRVVA